MAKHILIDNGHGVETPGKRSPMWPDGSQLFEWEFNRDIAKRVESLCYEAGIDCHRIVQEEMDISLKERARRADILYGRYKGDCVLLSIHANAGGGTGFEAYTTKGETRADKYATIVCREFEKEFGGEYKMRFDESDGDPDKEADFYILRNTKAPAVLLECFFMDNEKDCYLLMSEEGRERISLAIFRAIEKIVNL